MSDIADVRYDAGVSRELAEWRKATIHDLHYRIHFDIPANRNQAIEGHTTISFSLDKRDEVIIDFRDTEQIKSVTDGKGKELKYRLANEHIVIPKSELHEGDNCIAVAFTAGDQSINRNDEFVYTLLVPDRARTLFPCFDQPDLKAQFELSLSLPEEWVAVSNTAVSTTEGNTVTFSPTEPLSTYLFSFVAGKLASTTYDDGTHRFTAYYRETDPKRLAQLDDIFKEVAASIEWLEEYTGIAYPFAKYDFIMLPGFQYGGMEHTGATLYNDSQMFLGDNATLDEHLRRTQLIAHETAHMWFGDYVTMRWFDDVWTKEIFANYFAARMAEPLYPDVNHRLNRLKTYTYNALSEDRTLGTTSIRQELDNLRNAGLIYGQIIYNKAPIVMYMIVDIMGEEAFRKGIQEYLRTYAYGNATWPELIAILDKYTEEDLAAFSDVWVHQRGLPSLTFKMEGTRLTVTQHDKLQRGLLWPQSFGCRAILADGTAHDFNITMRGESESIALPEDVVAILPNSDGRGYGLFIPDEASREWAMTNIATLEDDLMRQSLIVTLHECYEWGYIENNTWLDFILTTLPTEPSYLVGSTLCNYLNKPMLKANSTDHEHAVATLAFDPSSQHQRALTLALAHVAKSKDIINRLYSAWLGEELTWLNSNDLMSIAWELALRMPEKQTEIIATQRTRISDPERLRRYDYISRATTPNSEERDALFESLMEPENRRIEPWTVSLLSLLNHHLRDEESTKYIYRGLEELQEVQRTGDIFFPRNWAGALLGGHTSDKAKAEVERFLDAHPDYPCLLRNKILQAADMRRPPHE
ncbi:MAG: ERAP1-like C-terminal domain-containing protein [Alistipes sp.]|nr:ERAP1-like C-terminal domain-containing protein [Alistipes sp.]